MVLPHPHPPKIILFITITVFKQVKYYPFLFSINVCLVFFIKPAPFHLQMTADFNDY